MCKNQHKALTRQIHGQWEEKILRLRAFDPNAKRDSSSPNLLWSVEDILKMWKSTEAKLAESI